MDKKGLSNSVKPFFEKVEKLTKIQRILISSALFLILIGVFVYFFFWPKLGQIKGLKVELANLQKELSIAKKNAKDLKKFQAKMKEAEAQFKLAMKKLPEKEEIPSLLSSISSSGHEVGLEFLLFAPKPEKKKEFYAEIPVAMNIRGDYHNLAIFFDQIARLNRIVNVRNIQMSRVKGKGSKVLNARCTAVTYKFIDPPPKKKKKKKKKKK